MSAVRPPEPSDIAGIADEYGLALSDDELSVTAAMVTAMAGSVDRLVELAPLAGELVARVPERRSQRPEPTENSLGAWYRRTEIRERDDGPLAGRTVAVKDSIAVGGVPMANGTAVLEGYVPDFDATVVARVLRAGGIIAGKAVCEPLCMSSLGHSAHTGPVRNPYDPRRATGGSSSGCAALVAARAVDLAIGGDNGGSIRIPSSWCGIYGLKPTWGLVPYTGAFAMNPQGDALGPMASTMADLETLLAVLAGPDGLDPRQLEGHRLRPPRFDRADELRIGVVAEGFGWEDASQPDVDAAVQDALTSFGKAGAQVRTVSIPLHRDSRAITGAATGFELGRDMFDQDGVVPAFLGHTDTGMTEWFHRAWRERARELSLPSKVQLVAGRYLLGQQIAPYLALAKSLSLVLRKRYDDALRDVHVLVFPTVTRTALPLPAEPLTPAEELGVAWDQSRNTRAFNTCGHPALNVPCAMLDGLPVGMMLVGARGDDATVVRAGRVFAEEVYAPPPPAGAQI